MAIDFSVVAERCGKCGEEFSTLFLDGMIVDRCTGCHGVWLDAGELDTLLRYYEQQHREAEESDGLRGLWARFVREIKAAREA